MASGVSTIALTLPIIASNAIFSCRRAAKGFNALDEHPVYGAMNMDIAAGQVLKGVRVAEGLAPGVSAVASSSGIFNTLAESGKAIKALSKFVDFTSKNINPIICVTSGVKVLGSDDKVNTAAKEALALTTMFASEGAAKAILAMPIVKNGGKAVSHNGIARSFVAKQIEALEETCATKKLFDKIPLNGMPSALKGVFFVLASIYGYKLGAYVAEKVTGYKEN